MDSLKLDTELNELHKLKDYIHKNYQNDYIIDLIIEEVFVNIISYSNADFIIVNIDLGKQLSIEFVDNGTEFNPLLTKPPKLEENVQDINEGGRGILLVKNYSDDLIYKYENNENHLTIIKNV